MSVIETGIPIPERKKEATGAYEPIKHLLPLQSFVLRLKAETPGYAHFIAKEMGIKITIRALSGPDKEGYRTWRVWRLPDEDTSSDQSKQS